MVQRQRWGSVYVYLMILLLGSQALASETAETWHPAEDCVENIRQVTCVVKGEEPTQMHPFERQNRPCIEDNKVYVNRLVEVYDMFPVELKPMFCHLRRINIETEYVSTGYARNFFAPTGNTSEYDGESYQEVRRRGWVLGLSQQKIFESDRGYGEWFTRKEMTLFGLDMGQPMPEKFPYLHASHPEYDGRTLQLFYVVLHEFGHMLDAANSVNQVEYHHCIDWETNEFDPACKMKWWGLFSSISWEEQEGHRPDSTSWRLYPVCYYGCIQPTGSDWQALEVEDAVRFYQSFFTESGFVTPYAATHSSEDFAESFAFYFLRKANNENPEGDRPGLKGGFFFGFNISGDQSHGVNESEWVNLIERTQEHRALSAKYEFVDYLMRSKPKFLQDQEPFPYKVEEASEDNTETVRPF